MSSYLSNILTNTTSRYNTLRANLTSSETDGDTEDDSHISRVLRAYYIEKGRSLPPWLPPDPRQRSSTPTAVSSQSFTSSLRPSSHSASMSNPNNTMMPPGTGTRSTSNLSDLWDPPAQQRTTSSSSQQQQHPMSLRRQAAERSGSSFAGRSQETLVPPQGGSQGRPLPSQRAGSYQSQMSAFSQQQSDPSPPSSSGSGGGTAQERLKARLWGSGGGGGGGGRSNSPVSGGMSARDRLYGPR